jgi:hypothetical protein
MQKCSTNFQLVVSKNIEYLLVNNLSASRDARTTLIFAQPLQDLSQNTEMFYKLPACSFKKY